MKKLLSLQALSIECGESLWAQNMEKLFVPPAEKDPAHCCMLLPPLEKVCFLSLLLNKHIYSSVPLYSTYVHTCVR
jgi:hypothetical protein